MVMAKTKLTYEECRLKRLEENKKRMEALHLPQLSQALSAKSSPRKPAKSPSVRTPMVAVRRSNRVAKKDAPVYEEVFVERLGIPKRIIKNKERDLSNRVYDPDEARAWAIERAEEVQSGLESGFPSFIKSMIQSDVSGAFRLRLPAYFCKTRLPRHDEFMTLVDQEGDKYQAKYVLGRTTKLGGGWKWFAIAHELADGDALVFELIRPTTFKVYIIRVNGFEEGNKP